MKFFTNKSIWSKIIIILIFIILFEFIAAKPSLGADVLEFGGKLLTPVVSLIVTLGDGIVEIMHSSIMGSNESLLHADLDSSIWEMLGKVFKFIIFAAVGIAFFLLTPAGIGAMASAAVGYFASSLFGNAWAALGDGLGFGSISSFAQENLPEDLYLPTYSISPEEIFQGKILLFNVDFFNKGKQITEKLNDEGKVEYYYYLDDNGKEVITSPQNIAEQLRDNISQWYVSLRNIALVCMMIVLLYIGIRMLLSTLASDKAKYRQMLQDWFMGLIILFFMHYIMAFSVTLVNKLTTVVSSSVEQNNFIVNIPDTDNGKLSEFVEEAGLGDIKNEATYINGEGEEVKGTVISWPTNLMGSLRLKAQLANWGSEYIGYALCFIILVFYTVYFVFTYLRRVLYMAFLTLMAPLVAVTYPIDKITDGQAQGFNKWFKEYIFNLLIQPMHLLLYYILVTSAFKLASVNVIYSLVAIGFMIPAERLLRSFFGFEKASTPGVLSGAAGGALAMGAISKIGNLGRGKDSSSPKTISSSDGGGQEATSDRKPRFDNNIESATGQEGENNGNEMNKQEMPNQGDDLNLQENNNLTGDSHEGEGHSENSNVITERNAIRNKLERRAKSKLAATKARAINGIKKLPGRSIRFVGKSAGAAALGTIGLAAGIASGDPQKAFSYGTAAGAAGYGLGGNLSGRFSTGIESGIPTLTNYQDPSTAYNQVYNGRQYEELLRQEYLDKMRKDNKGKLERNFDEKVLNKMLEDGGSFDQLVKSGIDDIDDIIAAQKMINNGTDVQRASDIAKYAKRAGSDYENKRKDLIENWSEEYQDTLGLSKSEAMSRAKNTFAEVKKFNKEKKYNYK